MVGIGVLSINPLDKEIKRMDNERSTERIVKAIVNPDSVPIEDPLVSAIVDPVQCRVLLESTPLSLSE